MNKLLITTMHEQLTKLENPITHINARHSSALTKKIPSDDSLG